MILPHAAPRLGSLALLTLLTLLAASRASAGLLESAELRLSIRPGIGMPVAGPVVFPGVGVAGSSSGQSSATLASGMAFYGTQQLTPSLTAEIYRNSAANLTGMPLGGNAFFEGTLHWRPTKTATLFGALFMFGKPGTYVTSGWAGTVGSSFPVTVFADRFSTGMVTAAGTGATPIVATGANHLNAFGVGTVQLVTPFRVKLNNLHEDGPFLGIATLELRFVPEPGMATVLGSGALALVLIGRRRIRG